jgi:biopolymer transport protein ExbB
MAILDYIKSGGEVMYILLAMNTLGVALIIWKFFSFYGEKKLISFNAQEILRSLQKDHHNFQHGSFVLEMAKDRVYSVGHSLGKGLNTIKIIATISPLLGLLGTALGVLSAFQAIATHGLSEPSFFANGISMALITTVGGLIVAIPHFISYNYLTSWLNSYEVKLEDQVFEQYLKSQNEKGEG